MIYPAAPVPSPNYGMLSRHKTNISNLGGGREQRSTEWLFDKKQVRLRYDVLTRAQIDLLWNFFRSTKGNFSTFSFFDLASHDHEDEFIAHANGTLQQFSLPAKTVVDDSTFKVYDDGVQPAVATYGYIKNGGFETAFPSGWTAEDAVQSSTRAQSGTYSAKLTASGANVNGPLSNVIIVNANKKYDIETYTYAESAWAGTADVMVKFYDDEGGTSLISSQSIRQYTSAAGGWHLTQKSVGPASLSPDYTFPANTKAIKIRCEFSGGTPTGDLYIDEVKVTVNGASYGFNLLVGGGVDGSDRVYFQEDNIPAQGSILTTDLSGILRINCRFNMPNGMNKNQFTYYLYNTGVELMEVKNT
jgi:hypothetical protein